MKNSKTWNLRNFREVQLKKYKRQWKENLVNEMNPDWRDLYEDFFK